MKFKKTLGVIVSLVISFFLRGLIGKWLASQYAYSGSFIGSGKTENLDGFVLGYVFFSSLLVPLFSSKLKYGFYATLPVLIVDIVLGAWNPQLWMDIVLLAAGLILAWIILAVKAKFAKK